MEINQDSTNTLYKKYCMSAVTNKAKIRILVVISEIIKTNAIYIYAIN